MTMEISETLSYFRSQIENRRLNSETLQNLESVLAAKDVESILEMRSAVLEILRFEISSVVAEIREKNTDWKLHTVDFFVKAFALVGDVEGCLALRYEALALRDSKCIIDPGLRVTYDEWFTFAKDSFDNGFYTIAVKGFENSLQCLQSNNNVGSDFDSLLTEDIISNIRNLKDIALALVSSHSVQTKSANYLKRKAIYDEQRPNSSSSSKEGVASLMFRSGIKKRNTRKLSHSQKFLEHNGGF